MLVNDDDHIFLYEPSDYEMISSWWEHHHHSAFVPPECLSTYGMIACVKDLPAAAGWLYIGNSALGWMEWIVTNPRAPMKSRGLGLKYLLERLCHEAQAFKLRSCFVSVKKKSLMRHYQRLGFFATETGMTNMVLNLCPSEPLQPLQSEP